MSHEFTLKTGSLQNGLYLIRIQGEYFQALKVVTVVKQYVGSPSFIRKGFFGKQPYYATPVGYTSITPGGQITSQAPQPTHFSSLTTACA